MKDKERRDTVIDLGRYRSTGVRVFAGRSRGRAVRKAAKINDLDAGNETVVVQVPDDTFAVTSSFILGLFGDSIARIGEQRFKEKYRFEGPSTDIIDDAIRYASHVVNPLQQRD